MTGLIKGAVDECPHLIPYVSTTILGQQLMLKPLIVLSLTMVLSAQTPDPRLSWFRQDKFGMFIHWGPYSALAGEWNGQPIPPHTEAEWIMQRFNIPVAEYRERAHQFNPVKFNAEAWVNLAKSTGMKYLVVTAKHHDGFAMYQSKVSNYNIVDWTPFKRDPLKELAEACRRAGIRFSVYYSHREDWDDPNGFGNNWDYNPAKQNFSEYLENKSKPQLRELLTNYGPLGLIWFDRGMDTPKHAAEFADIVHTLQPQCLINGRIGSYKQELMGDYQDMGDNGMPDGGLDEDWETPQTLNTTWGYSKFDQEWKTPGVVIRRLVEIVSKGGNYLLNIGPMADGTVPQPSVATLNEVGRWMKRNSESIYGTTASGLREFPWGRTTFKGKTVYLHVFSWPADRTIRLSGLSNRPVSARLLANPAAPKLPVNVQDGNILITVPALMPDTKDTVIALELNDEPNPELPIVTQDSDTGFELNYLTAVTSGKAQKRFNRDGGFHIAKWSGPQDAVTWYLSVSAAGKYAVKIRYAARNEWKDSQYVLAIGSNQLKNTVKPTGDWYQYQIFNLGTAAFPKAGQYKLELKPSAEYNHNLMYLESLTLEPVQ
jgi:alpha-L-fucosidase